MDLRSRLVNGPMVLSAMVSEVRDPSIATMFASSGLESLIIDMEHGMYGWSDMAAIIAVARGAGMAPIVRIPEIRREPIQKALDAGASGLLVPMVETTAQAAEVVRMAKYPPWGERGVALRRAHSDYGVIPDPVVYMNQANRSVALMMQIETRPAVDNARALAEVEGVDALFIGPWDLSVSLGRPGKTWDDESRAVYRGVLDDARSAGTAAGIHVTNPEQAKELSSWGFEYLSIAADITALMDSITASSTQIMRSQSSVTPLRKAASA